MVLLLFSWHSLLCLSRDRMGVGEVAVITGERVPLSARQWAGLCRKPVACVWLFVYVNLGLFTHWKGYPSLVCVVHCDPWTWSYRFASYWMALLSKLCSIKIMKEHAPFTLDDCDSLSFFLLPPFSCFLLINSGTRKPLRSKLSRSQAMAHSMPEEGLFRAEIMSHNFQTHVNNHEKAFWFCEICWNVDSWPVFASEMSCPKPPRKGTHASLKHPEGEVSLPSVVLLRFPGCYGTLRKHRIS